MLFRSHLIEAQLRKVLDSSAGFFTCIPADDPEAVSSALEGQGIYVVPLGKGVRVSIASISEEKCIKTAKAIAKIMK